MEPPEGKDIPGKMIKHKQNVVFELLYYSAPTHYKHACAGKIKYLIFVNLYVV